MEIDFLHSGDGIFLPIEVKSPEKVTYVGGIPRSFLWDIENRPPYA